MYTITASPEPTEAEKLDTLRVKRKYECFNLANQYRLLTPEQEAEKAAWYQAWLDVTETRVIPEKPAWLK